MQGGIISTFHFNMDCQYYQSPSALFIFGVSLRLNFKTSEKGESYYEITTPSIIRFYHFVSGNKLCL